MADSKRLFAEHRARFERMDSTGATAQAMAAEFGVSTRSIERWRKVTGRARPSGDAHPPADRERARRLLEDGCSIREVARTLPANPHTIMRWFPDAHRLTPQEAGHLSALSRLERHLLATPTLHPTKGTS